MSKDEKMICASKMWLGRCSFEIILSRWMSLWAVVLTEETFCDFDVLPFTWNLNDISLMFTSIRTMSALSLKCSLPPKKSLFIFFQNHRIPWLFLLYRKHNLKLQLSKPNTRYLTMLDGIFDWVQMMRHLCVNCAREHKNEHWLSVENHMQTFVNWFASSVGVCEIINRIRIQFRVLSFAIKSHWMIDSVVFNPYWKWKFCGLLWINFADHRNRRKRNGKWNASTTKNWNPVNLVCLKCKQCKFLGRLTAGIVHMTTSNDIWKTKSQVHCIQQRSMYDPFLKKISP